MTMCVCTDTCKLQHILDCHCCTAFQHIQSGKARATQLYMKQYLQIVHCQELGLAELTGCIGECMCIAVSFKGMWVVGLLIENLQAVLCHPLYMMLGEAELLNLLPQQHLRTDRAQHRHSTTSEDLSG